MSSNQNLVSVLDSQGRNQEGKEDVSDGNGITFDNVDIYNIEDGHLETYDFESFKFKRLLAGTTHDLDFRNGIDTKLEIVTSDEFKKDDDGDDIGGDDMEDYSLGKSLNDFILVFTFHLLFCLIVLVIYVFLLML